MATLYKYQTQGGQEVTFVDQEDQYKAEDIRKHWANTFPELGNAQADEDKKAQTVEVDGESVEVDRVVTFAKKVGTKGQDPKWHVVGEVGHGAVTFAECNLFFQAPSPDLAGSQALAHFRDKLCDPSLEWVEGPTASKVVVIGEEDEPHN
jgi:hypothetical protein